MMMRRWFVSAATVLMVVGVALRAEIVVAGQPGEGQGQIQGSLHSALRAAAKMTAKNGQVALGKMTAKDAQAAPGEMTGKKAQAAPGAGGEAGWEAKSFAEDPANLKGERVRAVEGEALTADRGAAGLEQMLRKLRTRASLMMIVAHPDDEDGGMLTYESRGLGARVGMLTLTRGEGGQNVVTGDFNDALGLVRTRELLAADRYMGVDQMFGTEVDFGFSKTKEEAFAKWTHERVLYDAVRAVRLYRPLVVTSVFIGAPSDGHGQHQVSGEIAQEVFEAAADPKVFPEMGLPAWAPMKVYARVPFARVDEKGMFDYATGKYVPARFYNYVAKTWSSVAPKADVTVPEGEFSAVLGKSYVQFAREGLALQRTQIGAGVRVAPAGRFDVGYTRYGSRVPEGSIEQEKNFFEGVDVTLAGIADLAAGLPPDAKTDLKRVLLRVDASVEQASERVGAGAPRKAAPGLRDGLALTRQLIVRVGGMRNMPERERYDVLHELRVKEVQFNDALVLALGLRLQAETTETNVIAPATEVRVPVEVVNGGDEGVQLRRYDVVQTGLQRSVSGADVGTGSIGAGARSASWALEVGEPGGREAATRPVFSRKDIEQPVYEIRDPRLRDAPLPVPAVEVFAAVDYGETTVRLGRVATGHRAEDGTVQPLMFEPGLSVSISPAAGVVPLGETSFAATVRVKSAERAGAQGVVQLALPSGWRSEPSSAEFHTTKAGEEQAIRFRVTPGALGERAYTMTAVAKSGGRDYREGYHAVGYPGLVRDNLYAPATYRARGVDVKVPAGLRVAYLPGTGDAVAASLEDIGIHATTVSVAEIAAGKLAGFDALVMGVRSYAAQKELPAVTGKLMAFANGGGVVVVQYQSGEYGSEDAPYPLSMGGGLAERVVEEDSRVQLLAHSSQVLSWPNRISEKDFGGWVEERGHGFMREWDARYEAVTEVHDAGQDPQKGGLLVARVGAGAYVYCAYALYRQLPEGVPGAFRLMANLVSVGKRP